MRQWSVWVEGYAATGEHGTAQYIGTVDAETFDDACRILHTLRGGEKAWGTFRPSKDGSPPSYWGCRLYETESEARASFG